MNYFMALTTLVLTTHAHAYAPTPTLEQLVASDIQAVVDDTVNEGDQTAHVIYNRSKPQVVCKISNSKTSPKQKWAFCRVAFLVQYEEASETRECKLLYSFEPKRLAQSFKRGSEDLQMRCLEDLSEGIE